jgi:hypothetical protein
VSGNFVGTNPAGTSAQPNEIGIKVGDSISGGVKNAIGGALPADRNLISGNGIGLEVDDPPEGGAHTIQGNYIGTDRMGTHALANAYGIRLASNESLIGGQSPTTRNLISGNLATGLVIEPRHPLVPTDHNFVWGNWIGTDASGRLPLGNEEFGIFIFGYDSGIVSTPSTLIGGDVKNKANKIAFNGEGGIEVEEGTGQTLLRNSIFSNGRLGIDLANDGITPNDTGDGDTGPNNLQNFPLLKRATSATRVIKGKLESTPDHDFTIEFFSNSSCDPLNYGEGKKFLGGTVVHTDGSGKVRFSFPSPKRFRAGRAITATATGSEGNTSEFSRCKTAG